MLKVIVDPNLYELPDGQDVPFSYEYMQERISYMCDVLELIYEYIGRAVVVSENEFEELCNFETHPWSQYMDDLLFEGTVETAFRDLMSLIAYPFSLNTESVAIPREQLNHSTYHESVCYYEFLKHIYDASISEEYLVFMGVDNCSLEVPLHFSDGVEDFEIYPIMDIHMEGIQLFSDSYRRMILNKRCVHPSPKDLFPNSDLCKKYYDAQNKMKAKGESDISVFDKVSQQVAYLNGYVLDKRVSRKNASDKVLRRIYSSPERDIFLSVDFETGSFEVYNHKGKHQGEYSYTGEKLKAADKTGSHDIRV